jgi:signal transduction histidine kinase
MAVFLNDIVRLLVMFVQKARSKLSPMRSILFFVFFSAMSKVLCSQEIVLTPTANKCIVEGNVFLQIDASRRFSDKDFGRKAFEGKFEKDARVVPNVGYSAGAVWLKFEVNNQSFERWLLEIDNCRIDVLRLYLVANDKVVYQKTLGDHLPFAALEVPTTAPVFRLPSLQQQRYTVYLQALGREDIKFPTTFWTEKGLILHLRQKEMIWGVYFGFIFLIAIYNFFFWLINRERIFISYVLYVLSYGLFQASLYGFGYEFLWGNSPFNDFSHVVAITLVSIFLTTFSIYYLNIFQIFSYSKPYFQLLFFGFLFVLGVTLFHYNHLTNYILIYLSFLMIAVQVGFCYLLFKKRFRNVKFYVLATLPLSLGSLVVGLMNLNALSAQYQDYILLVGSMLEIGLFAVSLSDRIRQMQVEKLQQQAVRDEIATNLHDDLAASLSSLTMFSQMHYSKSLKQNPELAAAFLSINARTREMMKQVREAVWEINPQNDMSDEWIDKLIGFAQETLPTQNIYPAITIDPKVFDYQWPSEKRRHVMFIFKEAINNIVKHAKATEVQIRFSIEKNHLRLYIADNGSGFEQNTITNGNGLANFRKHAKALRAVVKVDSEINGGTTLQLIVPIYPYN